MFWCGQDGHIFSNEQPEEAPNRKNHAPRAREAKCYINYDSDRDALSPETSEKLVATAELTHGLSSDAG
jgi:hypothetical protein